MKNLFGFNDQTWRLLDQISILGGNILMTLTIIGALVGFYQRNAIRRWLYRNRFPSIGGQPLDKTWNALVFTISRDDLPLWVIGQLKPQIIGLLVTDFSREYAQRIREKAESQGIKVFWRHVENPDDPWDMHQQAKALFIQMQQQSIEHLAIDITGGKTTMSLGAFMAAEESGVDSLYVSLQTINGKKDISTAKIIAISQAEI